MSICLFVFCFYFMSTLYRVCVRGNLLLISMTLDAEMDNPILQE